MRINVEGVGEVNVEDSFRDLSPEQQSATVDEIVRSVRENGRPQAPAAPAAPDFSQPQDLTPEEEARAAGTLMRVMSGDQGGAGFFGRLFSGDGVASEIARDLASEDTMESVTRPAGIVIGAVGRGVANVAGLPSDLGHLAADGLSWVGERAYNNGAYVYNAARGTDIRDDRDFYNLSDLTGGFGGSGYIKDISGEILDAVGLDDRLNRSDMTTGEKILSSVTEGTASGFGLGSLLTKAAAAARSGGGVLNSALQSYRNAPGAAIASEVASGAGGQLGADIAQDVAPDSVVAQILGGLAGGVAGGATANQIVNGRRTAQIINENLNPLMRETDVASNLTLNDARSLMSDTLTNKDDAVRNIDEAIASSVKNKGPLPTPGAASGDIGLMMFEKGMRTKKDVGDKAVAIDESLRQHAEGMASGLRDPGADPSTLTRRAEAYRDETVGASERQADAMRQAEVDRYRDADLMSTAIRNIDPVEQSVRFDDNAVGGMMDITREKNRLYRAIDPERNTEFDAQPIRDLLSDRRLNNILSGTDANDSSYSADFIRALNKKDLYEKDLKYSTKGGVRISEPGVDSSDVLVLRDVVETIPRLTNEIDMLRASPTPNVPRIEAVQRLRNVLTNVVDESVDPAARQATGYYRDTFAPLARGKDKIEKLQRNVVKGMDRGERGAFPDPANTLGSMVPTINKSREDILALNKLRNAARNTGQADEAIANFTAKKLADYAEKNATTTVNGVSETHTIIDPKKAEDFMRQNDMFFRSNPVVRNKIAYEVEDAQRTSRELAASAAARREAEGLVKKETEAFSKSVASKLIGGREAGPDFVVQKVKELMNPNRMDSAERLKELVRIVGNDEAAMRGLRSSVSEVLYDNLKIDLGGDVSKLTPGAMTKYVEKSRDILNTVYSPEQMREIDGMLETMRPISNIEAVRGGVVGSQTAALMKWDDFIRSAMYIRTGNSISAAANSKMFQVYGGLIGADKLSSSYRVSRLMEKAILDPELMSLILKGVDSRPPIRQLGYRGQNTSQGIRMGARENNDVALDEEDDFDRQFRQNLGDR